MCVCVVHVLGGTYSAIQNWNAVVSLDAVWESRGRGGTEASSVVSNVRERGRGVGVVCCGFGVPINVRHEALACCSQGWGGVKGWGNVEQKLC